MEPGDISELLAQLGDDAPKEERIEILAAKALELDDRKAEPYELAATAIASRVDDVIELARSALTNSKFGPQEKFFFFTLGAIRCRRSNDPAASRSWFDNAPHDAEQRPYYKHLLALTFEDSDTAGLKDGLELEREVYKALPNFAGAAHAIALFKLQIVLYDRTLSWQQRQEHLYSASQYVEMAISRRETATDWKPYAKFHYTRGRILRALGRMDDARAALRTAIERESRDSMDAVSRIQDYRLELALIDIDERLTAKTREVKEEAAIALQRTENETLQRLRAVETSVLAAVAFVASALALVQVTIKGFGDRSLWEALALIAAFGVVLFSAVAIGAAILRRR